MTDASVPPQDGPRELLSSARRLTRRVRQAQRGTWFPLLLFAVLTLGAIPVTLGTSHHLIACQASATSRACAAYAPAAYAYWPPALVLAYAAITAFYVRRARRRGVGTPVRPYVIAGIILAAAAIGASLWLVTHPGLVGLPSPQSPGTRLAFRLATPEAAIGLALLVLSRVERNLALLAFATAYLVILIFAVIPAGHFPWSLQAITAGVLLLGGIGFALAQRRARAS